MTKHIICLSLMAGMVFTSNLWAGTYSGGDGSEANPFLISDANDMNEIGVNLDDRWAHFLMTTDIDLADFDGMNGNPVFNQIGPPETGFYGVFDGNGHTISNFTYNTTETHSTGLFGDVLGWYGKGIIKNLTLVDPNVIASTGERVGALVGWLCEGYIWNCSIEGGTVSGDESVGTLVGYLTARAMVGNCRVEGSNVSGNMNVGGLVGGNSSIGTIDNCSAICTVTGNGNVGGLVGYSANYISNSYAAGNVLGYADIGGLVGHHNSGTLTNCYSKANVTGDHGIGGLVGYYFTGTVINCYAAGVVEGNNNTGGLIGYEPYIEYAFYTRCFWDNTVNPTLDGVGNITDPNVTGKSKAAMMRQTTFADWDFDYTWGIAEGQTYPYLKLFSAGDLDRSGSVGMADFAILANDWLNDSPWKEIGYLAVLDGIALMETILGALDDVDSDLIRMQQLAFQSATGSYSSAQRTIMNAEYYELLADLDNIAASTDYKGVRMLDGGLHSDFTINTGSEYIEIMRADMSIDYMGLALIGLDILTIANAQTALEAVNWAMNKTTDVIEEYESYLDYLQGVLNSY